MDTNQTQEQKQQNQIQFKLIESRLLGPMSLLVQSNTDDGSPAKGIDLILPAFTWALEVRLFLPVPEKLLTGKATEGYKRVDADVEQFIFSPPTMRLSVRFPESFYEKYAEYIDDKTNFKIMAYVLGYIDRSMNPNAAAQQQNQEQGSLEESNSEEQVAEASS
ncbi:MAG: hypothetical protein QNJ31_00845 [Candidatus Caenarcaniphilales bacterium]|nr:hypothetical protein [Candidatus Caenarcaniphilales bacterium]